jgi:serine/threonine protein kinase
MAVSFLSGKYNDFFNYNIMLKPERIDVNRMNEYYTVGSDVWSLGITMFELSTGRFPYERWNGIFQQLESVVKGKAPTLDDPRLSDEFRDFVNKWYTIKLIIILTISFNYNYY